MKFGKELKERSFREWEENYMSYKRLKRIIKKLIVQMKEREEMEEMKKREAAAAAANASSTSTASSSSDVPADEEKDFGSLMILSRDARKEFFDELDKELNRINTFFTSKLKELEQQYWTLYDGHVNSSAAERIRRRSETATAASLHHPGAVTRSFSFSATSSPHTHTQSTPTTPNRQRVAADGINATTSTTTTATPTTTTSLISPRAPAQSTPRTPIISPPPPLLRSHTITVSQQTQLEQHSDAILLLYRQYLQLLSFSVVNQQAFIKIMKKYDKYAEDNASPAFLHRLENEELVIGRGEIESKIEAVEELYMRNMIARNKDVKKVRQVLRAVQRDVEEGDQDLPDQATTSSPLLYIALAMIVTLLLSSLPLLPIHEQSAHRCLLLVALVTILWVTEAVPFFVTAMMIPFLVVIMQILTDAQGQVLTADKASKAAFNAMFSDSVILILGGFSISAAFSKCQYELRLTSLIQYYLGDRPRLFLLAYMFLAAFLSMLISNVATPILLTTLLLPILRDMSRTNVYARTLLLALAFACNVGGLMSPIASPESAIILGYLEEQHSSHSISWFTWMKLSLPLGSVAVVLIWGYLCLALLRTETALPAIPRIVYDDTEKISRSDWIVALTTCLSFVLWCSLSYARDLFGDMATVALVPLVIFFAMGILHTGDLRGFSWHLILLIAGGNVLGEAVRSSRLLHLLTEPLIPYLSHHDVWTVVIVISIVIFVITSFVPHTVAALILTPIVITIGTAIHHTHSLVFTTIFMLNLTMSLPITTFPNINSWTVDDDFHRPFLHASDFVRHGVVVSVMMIGLNITLGYVLLRLSFGKSVF